MYPILHADLTTDARDAFNDLYQSFEATKHYGGLDLAAFAAEPQPLLLVKGPLHAMQWLVAGDGTIMALSYGRMDDFTTDPIRRMEHPNPIGLFLAAAGMADARAVPDTGALEGIQVFCEPHALWTVYAASAGARAIAAEPIDADTAQDMLDAFYQEWREGMEDPFFRPADSTSWNQDESLAVETATGLLLTAAGVAGGCYNVDATQQGLPQVKDEDGDITEVLDQVTTILAAMFPASTFQGTEWEYNDGASDRASGYDERDATICVIDRPTPSLHAQMQAMQTLLPRLEALPDDAQRAWAALQTLRNT